MAGIRGRHALGAPQIQTPADVPYSQEPEEDGLQFFPRNESSPAMEKPVHGRRSAGYNVPDQDPSSTRHGRRAAERPIDASPGGWRRAPRHAGPSAPLPFPPLPTGADLPTNTDALELAPLPGPPAPTFSQRKKTRTLAAALATTGSIAAVLAVSGSSAAGDYREEKLDTGSHDVVSADRGAVLTHPRVKVGTKAAPRVTRKADPVTILPTPRVTTATAPSAPAVVKPPAAIPNGPRNATIAAAAIAQLGVFQDCTMLVTNSLTAAGISFHGWPVGYLSLGTIVPGAEAIAGDLAYYANGGTGVAHIAVYIGNGQAVHGGFNGNQTKIFSVNVGSGPVFLRVA